MFKRNSVIAAFALLALAVQAYGLPKTAIVLKDTPTESKHMNGHARPDLKVSAGWNKHTLSEEKSRRIEHHDDRRNTGRTKSNLKGHERGGRDDHGRRDRGAPHGGWNRPGNRGGKARHSRGTTAHDSWENP